jgi:hypothetical protein
MNRKKKLIKILKKPTGSVSVFINLKSKKLNRIEPKQKKTETEPKNKTKLV